ncbi:multicopper oxidase family protein [Intrasporangium calvum]|uniref:Multicopper oxidase family protein n=1 Tax=Intrasporangium calvum TaxID=53358 RepID=A0ABT5GIA0_9MICO|nr:multicopper oxidase family protein [Intrasporangium calvum]MDC5697977.1 multicopper oxidase family protein [Intrasporangium calvum]
MRRISHPLVSRRSAILGGLGIAGMGALTACAESVSPGGPAPAPTFGPPTSLAPTGGQRVVTAALTPQPVDLDLGGLTVRTWAYGDRLPGQVIRASAGDLLRVSVDNRLPTDTSVHWHGIRLRPAADGVPGVTQDPIKAGTTYVYEFTAPDPGTYFFHPHTGAQLDRGLYAPLIIDDPQEPGGYDAEWVVVLDDWIDGTGTTPDDILEKLLGDGGAMGMGHGSMDHGSMGSGATGSGSTGMGDMDHGSMPMGADPFGDAGDVAYPYYLVNGRLPTAPETFTAKPGQRVRIRIINAASDTIFSVALGGHDLTVTHSDGFPVVPVETRALYIGMGERYDVTVTLAEGVFPLHAAPFGKQGDAMALVRTASGTAPTVDRLEPVPAARVLLGSDLRPAESARLDRRAPDATVDLTLDGQMQPYQWGMNGAPFGKNAPLSVKEGQRLRINVVNRTMMTHPVHLHGHTFALADSGLRKDTVLLRPMESRPIELDADNPGDWMIHCHNIYHAEAGMMIKLSYEKSGQ